MSFQSPESYPRIGDVWMMKGLPQSTHLVFNTYVSTFASRQSLILDGQSMKMSVLPRPKEGHTVGVNINDKLQLVTHRHSIQQVSLNLVKDDGTYQRIHDCYENDSVITLHSDSLMTTNNICHTRLVQFDPEVAGLTASKTLNDLGRGGSNPQFMLSLCRNVKLLPIWGSDAIGVSDFRDSLDGISAKLLLEKDTREGYGAGVKAGCRAFVWGKFNNGISIIDRGVVKKQSQDIGRPLDIYALSDVSPLTSIIDINTTSKIYDVKRHAVLVEFGEDIHYVAPIFTTCGQPQWIGMQTPSRKLVVVA